MVVVSPIPGLLIRPNGCIAGSAEKLIAASVRTMPPFDPKIGIG
jgi:hypothetical protein